MSSTYIPADVRRAVENRDGHRCVYCQRSRGVMTLDHVTPEVDGGPTEAGNLVVCCEWCNNRKGSIDMDLFARFLERRGFGPWRAIVKRVNLHLKTPTE